MVRHGRGVAPGRCGELRSDRGAWAREGFGTESSRSRHQRPTYPPATVERAARAGRRGPTPRPFLPNATSRGAPTGARPANPGAQRPVPLRLRQEVQALLREVGRRIFRPAAVVVGEGLRVTHCCRKGTLRTTSRHVENAVGGAVTRVRLAPPTACDRIPTSWALGEAREGFGVPADFVVRRGPCATSTELR